MTSSLLTALTEDEIRELHEEELEEAKAEAIAEGRAKGIAEGRQQGLEQGIEQGIASIVLRLLSKDIPVGEISRLTDIPLEEIEVIIAKNAPDK